MKKIKLICYVLTLILGVLSIICFYASIFWKRNLMDTSGMLILITILGILLLIILEK